MTLLEALQLRLILETVMALEEEDFDTNFKEEENPLHHSEKDSPSELHTSTTSDESKRNQMKKPKSHSVDHNTRKHFSCNDDCCETYRRERSHTEHCTTYMKGNRHRCSFCDKDFLYRSQLNIHMKYHTNYRSFVCEVCDATFVQKSVLRNHMISHSEENLYSCEICNKNFRRKKNLDQHFVIHIDDKPHKCIVCQKTFKRLFELKSHSLTHSDDKPYKCIVCQNSFKCVRDLNSHSLNHSDNKPHKCIVCGKTFKRLSYLKQHSLTHSDNKPHKCIVCHKTFKLLHHLKSHSLTHSDNKSHKCIVCPKTFKRFSELKKHSKTHSDTKTFRTEAFLDIHSHIHNTSTKGSTQKINTFERDQLVEVSEIITSSPDTRIWEKDIGVHESGKFGTEGNLRLSTTESTLESDLSYISEIDLDPLPRACFAREDSKNKPIEGNHPSIIRNSVFNFICKLCGTKIKDENSCSLNSGVRSYRCAYCDVTYTQVKHDEESAVSQII